MAQRAGVLELRVMREIKRRTGVPLQRIYACSPLRLLRAALGVAELRSLFRRK